jgi:uncharacterized membrane protein YphA (DoxX/SURF4 family)
MTGRKEKWVEAARSLHATMQRLGERIEPALFLAIRLWVGEIFFSAGYHKLLNFINGEGAQMIDTFDALYALPLPAIVAAPLVTGVEFLCGGLLILGLLSRYVAWVLVIETLIIQMVVPMMDLHLPWMLLLLVIAVRGPGSLSVDTRLSR